MPIYLLYLLALFERFFCAVKSRVLAPYHLEANAGFFRLSMKRKVDVYLL